MAGKPQKTSLRANIENALKLARMEQVGFRSHDLKPEFPLPRLESEVDAFILGRTKIWRETWLIPALEGALAKIKSRDVKKHPYEPRVSRAREVAVDQGQEPGMR